jgi:hypothetical protein
MMVDFDTLNIDNSELLVNDIFCVFYFQILRVLTNSSPFIIFGGYGSIP